MAQRDGTKGRCRESISPGLRTGFAGCGEGKSKEGRHQNTRVGRGGSGPEMDEDAESRGTGMLTAFRKGMTSARGGKQSLGDVSSKTLGMRPLGSHLLSPRPTGEQAVSGGVFIPHFGRNLWCLSYVRSCLSLSGTAKKPFCKATRVVGRRCQGSNM